MTPCASFSVPSILGGLWIDEGSHMQKRTERAGKQGEPRRASQEAEAREAMERTWSKLSLSEKR